MGIYFKQIVDKGFSVFRSKPPWHNALEIYAIEIYSQLISGVWGIVTPLSTDVNVFYLKNLVDRINPFFPGEFFYDYFIFSDYIAVNLYGRILTPGNDKTQN